MASMHAAAEQQTLLAMPSMQHYRSPSPKDAPALPSSQDPFEFASIRIVAAHPSVSGEISTLHPPRIYWAWGEAHPKSMSYQVASGRCGAIFVRVDAGDAALENAMASFSTSFHAASAPLSSQPIQTPLQPSELEFEPWKEAASNASAPEYLNVTLSAEITIHAEVRESGSEYACSGNQSCKCSKFLRTHSRKFSRHVSDSASFRIQAGTPFLHLLSPPLGDTLAYRPSVSVLVLSSRKPSELSLALGNAAQASFAPFSYSISSGQFGEGIINSTPSGAAHGSLFEERHISFQQLSKRNASYFLILNSTYPNQTGRSSLSAIFQDEFGDSFGRQFSIRVRLPYLPSPAAGGLKSAAQPALPLNSPGNDSALPASIAPPLQPSPIDSGHLWPLAALVAAGFFLRALPSPLSPKA